jgi:hypothetical protein
MGGGDHTLIAEFRSSIADWIAGLAIADWIAGLAIVDGIAGLPIADWIAGLAIVDGIAGLPIADCRLRASDRPWRIELSIV